MNEQIDDCNRAKLRGHINDNKTNDTGLPKHALEFNHTFDVLGAQVLHKEKATARRKCLEGLYIHLQPNTCNGSASTHPWTPSGQTFSPSL